MANIKASVSTSNSSVSAIVNPSAKVVPSRVDSAPPNNNPAFTGNFSHTGGASITGALSVGGTITGNVTGNVTGNLTGNVTGDVTGNLTGVIQTAAQPNITSLGTLPTLNVVDLNVTGTSTGIDVNTGLTNLTDTTITNATQGDVIFYNGTSFINEDLATANIATVASLNAHTSASNPHNISMTSLGFPNVENKSSADIRGEITDSDIPSSIARDSEISGLQTALTFGIANGNSVIINSADVADDDYAKFTSTGLEGRSATEVKTDLSLDNVENKSSATIRGEIVDADIPSTIARDAEVTSSISTHTALSNPHNITATKIGLGNVTNESKATMFTNPTFTGTTTLNDLTIDGDLTLNGTTTTINSTTLTVDDKNIELGSTTSPTDAGANQGGITLKGTTDKTFQWIDNTDAWTSSENLDLATNKVLKISGDDILSSDTLGATVINSSLRGVGTIGSGVWEGTAIGSNYIGNLPASKITSGVIADDRISASSVTQHQLQINGVGTIGTGVWQGTPIEMQYLASIPTSKISSGTWADSRITVSSVTQHQGSLSIATSQLTGTISDAQISEAGVTQHQSSLAIAASQITSGTISDSRIPSTITRDSELAAHTGSTSNPHSVTKTQVGLGNVENKSSATIRGEIVDADIPSTIARDTEVTSSIAAHTALSNPHGTSKSDVGLGNVDNTADTDKPISTAAQSAIDAKAPIANPTFTGTATAPAFSGPLTGTVTGDVVGDLTGDVTGNLTGNVTGDLTGTIQTQAQPNIRISGTQITTGTIPNARISVANITQHQDSITSVGTLDDLDVTGDADVGGNANITGNAVIGGNLTVNGTTTTINSTTLSVDDKNLELGQTSNPTDAAADDGGITLKGTTDKTFQWKDATDSWTSSENLDLASGKTFKINGTNVLSNNTLGSGVTSSSLTGLGTISTGVWQGTAIADAYIASSSTWNTVTGKQDALTFGIADTNALKVDGVASLYDYAKFTVNGLEGRNNNEVKTDLGLNNVENTALSTFTGTSNIATLASELNQAVRSKYNAHIFGPKSSTNGSLTLGTSQQYFTMNVWGTTGSAISINRITGTNNAALGNITWFNDDNDEGTNMGQNLGNLPQVAQIGAFVETSDDNNNPSDSGANLKFYTKPEGAIYHESLVIQGDKTADFKGDIKLTGKLYGSSTGFTSNVPHTYLDFVGYQDSTFQFVTSQGKRMRVGSGVGGSAVAIGADEYLPASGLHVEGDNSTSAPGRLSLGAANATSTLGTVGTLIYTNRGNGATNANNTDTVSGIYGKIITSDNNADGDSGGILSFYTKPESGPFTEQLQLDTSGTLNFMGGGHIIVDDTIAVHDNDTDTKISFPGDGQFQIECNGNTTAKFTGNNTLALGGTTHSTYSLTIPSSVGSSIAMTRGSDTNAQSVGMLSFVNLNNAGNSGTTVQSIGDINVQVVTDDSNASGDSGGKMNFILKGQAGYPSTKMTIDHDGVVSVVGLIETTHTIRHTGDDDTKIGFPANDNLTLEAGGVEGVRVTSTEVVVNEGSADVAFRVESDTKEHALFVKGDNGYVGISTSAPDAPLHVSGTSGGGEIIIESATNAIGILNFAENNVNGKGKIEMHHGSFSDTMKFFTSISGSSSERLRINYQGAVVTGTVTANGYSTTSGNYTTTSGNITATNGNVSAGGTITSTSSVSRPIQNDETDTTPIRNIRRMTQAQYNAIAPDANTMYIIV